MKTLILKLNATGDVVRTTTLLRAIDGDVVWITAPGNRVLLEGVRPDLRVLAWDDRDEAVAETYDLVINLEDEVETARFAGSLRSARRFGAVLQDEGVVAYTPDAHAWFDMSLISSYGRKRADELKFLNRRSYQDLVFAGLGLRFIGQEYLLPRPVETDLRGDVAVAPVAGPVWPMKNWAYYPQMQEQLEARGLRVNVLPRRNSLLEHLGDIAGHRVLVGGDSLPMHLALGLGIQCVTIFNCTSPWEIHDYGRMTKVVSPLLGEFFYQRGSDPRAMNAVTLDEVLAAIDARLQVAKSAVRE